MIRMLLCRVDKTKHEPGRRANVLPPVNRLMEVGRHRLRLLKIGASSDVNANRSFRELPVYLGGQSQNVVP